eukprot:gene454-936_t
MLSRGGPKTFRAGDPMDEKEAARTWESLKDALTQIHAHNASTLSFEELYRNAYNLVLHKYGDLLYQNVRMVVTNHLQVVGVIVRDATDNTLLEELKKQWDDHKTVMVMIRDILMYMDRNFVNQYKKIPVYDMGLTVFREQVICQAGVRDRLLEIMLKMIADDRAGLPIDKILLKHTVTMLVELGVQSKNVYREFFEDKFLASTKEYYKKESTSYISENTCPDFLIKAETRILEEKGRIESYLHDSTMERINQLMDQEWIVEHCNTLISMENSGACAMFTHDKSQDLARMYHLFQRVPSTLKEIQRVMMECIENSGKEVLADPERCKEPVNFVESLLGLKTKYDVFVQQSFRESKDFQQALKTAFESFLNRDTRTAQYLSLFVDDLFRKGLKGMAEQDVDTALEQVVTIFRFLQDKDIFENFYKQHLAKRLLMGRSLSDEAERSMISKLKSECGHLYTSKLEGMFSDMKLSEEVMKAYKQTQNGAGGSASYSRGASGSSTPPVGLELKANVLTSGFWPNSTTVKINFPTEIQEAISKFETFYLARHTGRRLSWQPHQGSADVKAFWPNAPRPRFELNVSTYQMCVLLLFNSKESWTYQEIAESSWVEEQDSQEWSLFKTLWEKSFAEEQEKEKEKREEKRRRRKRDGFNNSATDAVESFRSAMIASELRADARPSFHIRQAQTQIPIDELKRHLMSLYVNPKCKVLTKTDEKTRKDPADQDVLALNSSFESKFYRMKVPLVALKQSAANGNPETEGSGVNKLDLPPTVEEDRKHLVEAVIVRIMKSRKSLNHNQLVEEVIKHLTQRFQPSLQLIKQRIEKLIERDFTFLRCEDSEVHFNVLRDY